MVDRLVNSEANARRITMVENCFGSSGQPLKVPGRVLVGEGVLTKICRKKPKPRQFFLFNDILVYGTILINKTKYNQEHIIPLEDVKLENIEDDGSLRNGWLVRTSQKSFAVYAATATEKSEWMAHLSKCIQDLLKKSGKKATTEHAAVWIPDAEATMCMHCKKTQFNMLYRRHHCRKCGAVVCGPCSGKKIMLPSQSSKPLRVCLNCFDLHSKALTDSSSANVASTKATNHAESQESSGEDDSDTEDDLKEGNVDLNDKQSTMFYGDDAGATTTDVATKTPKRPPPPTPTRSNQSKDGGEDDSKHSADENNENSDKTLESTVSPQESSGGTDLGSGHNAVGCDGGAGETGGDCDV